MAIKREGICKHRRFLLITGINGAYSKDVYDVRKCLECHRIEVMLMLQTGSREEELGIWHSQLWFEREEDQRHPLEIDWNRLFPWAVEEEIVLREAGETMERELGKLGEVFGKGLVETSDALRGIGEKIGKDIKDLGRDIRRMIEERRNVEEEEEEG